MKVACNLICHQAHAQPELNVEMMAESGGEDAYVIGAFMNAWKAGLQVSISHVTPELVYQLQ
jgi:hypothetical protein